MIIKIDQAPNGSHANQSTTPQIIPDGWIEVPSHLEGDFIASGSFCNLAIEGGVLVGITPTELPEQEPDTTAEIYALKAELAATDYQIIKCSEYQLAGLEMPYDLAALHESRQTIRDQINRLEAEHE